ncbi:MAG TPA: polyketide cyclase / dehydrase and lipid transport [Jatrophihabitantaceae bacterium]|nr:polyketide cyclase / dehydrase and lipid transport [Jatrophihabitantaceae bacterium]
MPQIDLVDETWIRTSLPRLAAEVADPANWRRWWPDLRLEVDELRGLPGVRWSVRSPELQLAGAMEVWLEAAADGVLLHYFLRLDPLGGRVLRPREVDRIRRSRALHAKRIFWKLKDDLEGMHR